MNDKTNKHTETKTFLESEIMHVHDGTCSRITYFFFKTYILLRHVSAIAHLRTPKMVLRSVIFSTHKSDKIIHN